ncbi:hypothetical protein [uncultured Vibrio sp.]|uniref:hypothetical protein n=1 Tax=uncultured Vibrio sp. TaxID=114054 RepID=UPI00260B8DF8|nr:hypothetical protein [uncultured Vibrio sp.]
MNNTNTKLIITTPIAAIIITLIACLSILFALGSFNQPKLDYATVRFDGGYKKIGVISEQRSFSSVEVKFDDEVLWSGSFSYVADEIAKNLVSEKDSQSITTWKAGVTLNGTAGVSWLGSDSSFKLTTENINLTSTQDAPLVVQDVINQLRTLDRKIKDEIHIEAEKALTFSESPNASFILTRLVSTLKNL